MQRRHAFLLVVPAFAVAVGIAIAVVSQSSADGNADRSTAHLRTPGVVDEPSGAIPTAPKLAGRRVPSSTFDVLTGGSASFATLAGRPIVINVWAESCVPCKAEMPAFEAVHRAFGDRVTFVGMNDGSDADETALAFAAKAGVTYALWRDHDAAFTSALGIAILPTTLVVDADGIIVQTHSGALTADKLTAMIDRVLSARGPADTSTTASAATASATTAASTTASATSARQP